MIMDIGEGTPLILMHGTLLDHRMFEPQYEDLRDAMRVVGFDYRARTANWQGPYDLDDLADDCVGVLDERGIDRCVVGGMSMGAFTALRVALKYPDRVAGLILIGGQATAYSVEDQKQWTEHYAARRGHAVGDEFAAGEVGLNFCGEVASRRPELLDRWRSRFADANGSALYDEVMSWLGMADVRDRLGEIAVPTLIVHGDRDACIPVGDAVEMYRLIDESELLVLPRTGHAANLERPHEVNRAIREFVARLDVTG